jgi:tyrosyl-tRNA synthetase
MLRTLQDAGHEIIFVIGDFTGMVGDPSGRSKTRQSLTFEQTRANAESYMRQVTKILNADSVKITYNSEWLGKLNFVDVLELSGKYTLARILERDDFANRFGAQQPIGIHELLYPLMQGYDSVALGADIEVGGTDQTFNLLVGRELQRDYGQNPQEVITFPLLPGLDGKEKMSKSLDNYIGVDEPAGVMFEKCMRVPDTLMSEYFRLTTDIDNVVFTPLVERDIREAHFVYARAVTSMYNSECDTEQAELRYLDVAAGHTPDTMDMIAVSENSITVLEILKRSGFAVSNSDARRLVSGRAVKLDGIVVSDAADVVTSDTTLSCGKNRFAAIRFGERV